MANHAHDSHAGGHGTKSQLITGFVLSVILTVIPFALVMGEVEMSRGWLIGIIMGLGGIQILVHLGYFLHLGRGEEDGWRMASTVFAVVILVIVLAGSLWVMHNMNVNMMPADHGTMPMDPEAVIPSMMEESGLPAATEGHAGH